MSFGIYALRLLHADHRTMGKITTSRLVLSKKREKIQTKLKVLDKFDLHDQVFDDKFDKTP